MQISKTMHNFKLFLAIFLALIVGNLCADDAYYGFIHEKSLEMRHEDEALLKLTPAYWEPNWKWTGIYAKNNRKEGEAGIIGTIGKANPTTDLKFELRINPTGKRTLEINSTFTSDQDAESTQGAINLVFGPSVSQTVVSMADGSSKTIVGSYGLNVLGENVTCMIFLNDEKEELMRFVFEKPTRVDTDKTARIVVVSGKYLGDTPYTVNFKVEFSKDIVFYPNAESVPFEEGFDKWFVWQPHGKVEDGNPLAMNDWVEKPAGLHGRIRRLDDKLMLGDQPIKLWGINLNFTEGCAPVKDLADKRATFYPRYGINAIRLLKYADEPGWGGIQSKTSFTQFNPDLLDRMDYQIAKLKEQGIYFEIAAHAGATPVGPDDIEVIPYLEEFGPFNKAQRIRVPQSGIFYSKEVQDLQIAHYVNLLKHRNPYTGLTYAEDPVIAFLEIVNEQSSLWYTTMEPLKLSPTLRERTGKRFCNWLREKYKTHEGLIAAWGEKSLNSFGHEGFATSGEHLDANNILPIGNPWFWDPDNLNSSQAFRRQRLLDTMVFLTMLQDECYERIAKAIREAGYDGELTASNWQAGRAFSHFMNLYSDYQIGTIDRHNYFGGYGRSMLPRPGLGLFGSGLQQVVNRPFMFSEWIHVKPNEFGVEGPAVLGAYGMGLQGWDASFVFQNSDKGEFMPVISREYWEVMAPQIMGVFPAVSRQVLRGDVRESDVSAIRKVHVPSLAEGIIGFSDIYSFKGDVKDFEGSKIPSAALAVARCSIEFTDKFEETREFDMEAYRDGQTYVSTTDQLRWTTGEGEASGFVTIDTEATQAVVGFAAGQDLKLSRARIAPAANFGAIYLTTSRPGKTLDNAESILVVSMGRARNSGAKSIGTTLIESGKAPIRLEPIKAEITLVRQGNPTIWVLDHDGNRTERKVPFHNGTFVIDGAEYQTPYYEVSYTD